MSETLKYFIQLLFGIFLTFYGGHITISSIRNNKKFIDSYKKLDLIKLFGDFGRILYAIIGLIVCIGGVLISLRQVQNLTTNL